MHTHKNLAELLIKRLKIIARPLLMKYNISSFARGHIILHAAAIIRLRPTAYHKLSLLQLISEREPNLSYLKIFGYVVYVLISPPQRTKIRLQKRL
jgi:hypothetical protein